MKSSPNSDFRKRLFIVLMILLAIPLVQTLTRLVHERPLKGAVMVPANPDLDTKGWFSGDYQVKKEKYLNDAFGFRSFFVRLNNQLALSLFREVHAFSVIFGKENYLFEENYLKAWYGADFIGTDSLSERVEKLKYIQDQLRIRYNKNLVVVIAAGKGSFFPEYFPDYPVWPKGPTNYETLVRLASRSGLEIIDFNRWFMENKSRSPYPLYPRYGIHWSVYGETLVADSLIGYISKIRNIDMPRLKWDRVEIRKAQRGDYDMGAGLNLLFSLKRDKMAYPVVQFEDGTGKTKPSVMVVADSFYWGLFKMGITRAFSTSDFWFYNKEIFHTETGKPELTSQADFGEQIRSHDVIMLMATEANLPGLGWGFIDELWEWLKKQENPDKF